MNLKNLLNERKIEKVEKSEFNSRQSEKDIVFAKKGMETGNYSRVMTVAYEAVLRLGINLMNSLGYRAIGIEHHRNVFEFLRVLDINKDLIDFFDMIRKRRNDFVYRDADVVGEIEAKEIIKKSEDFVREIRTFVQKNRTSVKEVKNE